MIRRTKWSHVSIFIRTEDRAKNVILIFLVTLTSENLTVSEEYRHLLGGEIRKQLDKN